MNAFFLELLLNYYSLTSPLVIYRFSVLQVLEQLEREQRIVEEARKKAEKEAAALREANAELQVLSSFLDVQHLSTVGRSKEDPDGDDEPQPVST